MKIETKYDIGDIVLFVKKTYGISQEDVACSFNKVEIKDIKYENKTIFYKVFVFYNETIEWVNENEIINFTDIEIREKLKDMKDDLYILSKTNSRIFVATIENQSNCSKENLVKMILNLKEENLEDEVLYGLAIKRLKDSNDPILTKEEFEKGLEEEDKNGDF